jgi:hypothetical protein
MSPKTAKFPNLLKKPARPAAGRGRLQQAAKRALLNSEDIASTSEIIEYGFALQLHRGERRRAAFSIAMCRALRSVGAERVGRAKTIGRPWLWRLPRD